MASSDQQPELCDPTRDAAGLEPRLVEGEPSREPLGRWAWLIVLVAVVWTCITLPPRITDQKYLPGDDALRHAAKAVSGRTWQDVLVLRPDVTLDPHPGWHAVLTAVHRGGVERSNALVAVAVCALASLVMLAPLPGVRRPEAWVLSLLLAVVTEPALVSRLFLGRPFLVSMATLLLVGATWRRLDTPRMPRGLMIALGVAFALSTWTHGNPYLWAMPALAFALAGRTRVTVRVWTCMAVGIGAGLLLTGQPLAFLEQTLLHPLRALGTSVPTWLLVGEFQASTGSPYFLALVGVAVALAGRPGAVQRMRHDPMLWLLIGAWVAGLATKRVWLDWGMPAALLLLTGVLEERLEADLPARSTTRVLVALLACAALTLSVSADHGRRWSSGRWRRFAPVFADANATWLPGPGGVLYNTDMGIFYLGFFTNPEAPYRYLLGFEPGLLPGPELGDLRAVQQSGATPETLKRWVARLRPEDRIVVSRRESPAPGLPNTEWNSPMPGVWMGRLARTGPMPSEP